MENCVHIRKISKKDIDNLKNLERQCFDESVNENFSLAFKSGYVYFCVLIDNKIVGYVGASYSYEQSDLTYICVASGFRRLNIATKLLSKLVDYLKDNGVQKLFLEVNENNIAAINLYSKFGFKQISKRKNYYNGSDAIVMEYELK